ncbi:uncharacterized protein LOC143942862 [Lithobates pipiens]
MQRKQYRSRLADMGVLYSTNYRRMIFQLLVASLLHFLTVSGEDPSGSSTHGFHLQDLFSDNYEEETTTFTYDLLDYSEFEVIVHERDPEESSGSFLQPSYVTLITFFLYLIHYIWH